MLLFRQDGRPLGRRSRSGRRTRRAVAVAAALACHLIFFICLQTRGRSFPSQTFGDEVVLARLPPAPVARRSARAPSAHPAPAPVLHAQASPPVHEPPAQLPSAAADAPQAAPRDFGRWSVRTDEPGSGSARFKALEGCEPERMAALSGQSLAACRARLARLGDAMGALPLIADREKAARYQAWADYQLAKNAWRKAPLLHANTLGANGPKESTPPPGMPLPPDDPHPPHRWYVDKSQLSQGNLVVRYKFW